jgi:molybdopterin/thiamine biosynthesis adenylyltransferase
MSADRYESLRLIEGWDHQRLQQRTVMVVGIGALGNEVAKNLLLLGIGRIVLVDFDDVSTTNLSRSILFRAADSGQPKVSVAATGMKEINPDVKVLPLRGDVVREVGLGVFRRVDLVFGCVDNVAARYHLNRRCWRVGIPWIEGGIAGHIGSIKAFRPPSSACYECTMSASDRSALSPRRTSCDSTSSLADRPSAATTPMIASITGALMVQQGLALLSGKDIGGHGWTINAATGESVPFVFNRREGCFSHDEYITERITEMAAFAAGTTLADFVEIASSSLGPGARLELDRSVVTELECPHCGRNEPVWLDRDDLAAEVPKCPHCGNAGRRPIYARSIGHDSPWIGKTLAGLGIPPLDILVARNGRAFGFFELTHDTGFVFAWS